MSTRFAEPVAMPAGAVRSMSARANVPALEGFELDEEFVRDLRHCVGNHFHKLFYWADLLAEEPESAERVRHAEALTGALQRFQEELETGLRYFEPDRASPVEMGVAEVASATQSLLRTEVPAVRVDLDLSPEAAGHRVRLDPQRFSLALRLLVEILGGTRRESLTCRFTVEPQDGRLALFIEAAGGDELLGLPIMQWAIARKTVAMQGGEVRPAREPDGGLGGVIVTLPLGE